MTVRRAFEWLVLALAAIACLVTAVSAIRSDQWWIRVLDFPRVPMIVGIALLLVAAAFVRTGRLLAMTGLAVAGGWQLWRIHDYTRLVAPETAYAARAGDDPACFEAIGLNVFQHNRDYSRTIAMLRRERPDLMVLMETDGKWLAALRPLLSTYGHVFTQPIGNTYGMIVASRLPVGGARFEQPTAANTPTFYARITTRGGASFDYVALHPRPPLPGQDTGRRDANIARASRRHAGDPMPSLAMGDFNDVAWSHTTQRFKTEGGYHDPRIGRGVFATFPADHITFGWPLDQVFVTPDFVVRDVTVLDSVGSDHRPLRARLCLPEPQRPRR